MKAIHCPINKSKFMEMPCHLRIYKDCLEGLTENFYRTREQNIERYRIPLKTVYEREEIFRLFDLLGVHEDMELHGLRAES